ncbi:hypothetical protein NZD89_14815 [Alicyclobacillus fastidiosus]|uniref:Uncharacterized protein n=1 Tax=Alicyclobacillus fastidiosus TaxID=392011 RepID=A0ABY6Z9Y5_9BACL|nr:hypothetical protein [Alicyclobacillus fastidiosus]WAH39690.1 hypothetical protein NZD89_14815 [Alicyclobacillus fastidiosus]
MSRVRLVPIVLIAIVALAVLFGGWQAYQHFNLLGPLKKNLQQVEGVQTVDILTGSPDVVQVQLGPFSKLKNGDLQQTYDDITSQVSSKLGTGVTLQLSDDRSGTLAQALENFNPVLLEGVTKGNYTEMISQVTHMAKSQGINCRVTMDTQYIYIQLAKGGHYLYKVMPYSTHQGGAAS